MLGDKVILKRVTGRDWTRELVRIRDNYTCQDCGDIRTPEMAKKLKKRKFDCHHINGLCGKKSRKYDKVEDIHEMVTLCHQCHFRRPEHNVYREKYKEKRNKDFLERVKVAYILHKNSVPIVDIGKYVGCTKDNVYRLLKRARQIGL